ncbi:MAG: thiolase family protein [Syntrophomonadaceae bacterium]|jgi:acetyl-CoA C-acetyltransferase|nr:thiolase family protein [Syntrophomonadaceae bacterium]
MRGKLKEGASIVGVGCTRFGDLLETPEIKGLSMQELAAMAAQEAMEDANISPQELDAVFVGHAMVHSTQLPGTYSQLSKWIGAQFKAGVHFEAQCSTTNVGAAMAAMAIASGVYEKVLVVGLEATRTRVKDMSPYERVPISTEEAWAWTDYAVNQAYSVPQGYEIFSVYNGLVALGYCRKYGIAIEDYDRAMFELCRTRRLHGAMNPKAILQETLEDEAARLGFSDPWEFWKSRFNPFVAWPCRIRNVVTVADGASAMVLVRKDAARYHSEAPVDLLGFGIAYSDLPWYDKDPSLWPIDRLAWQRAYQMSGVSPRELDYLHTHDCSNIVGMCNAELSGYIPEGKWTQYARDGRRRYDGDRPMSTHGGRHAFGHAWAASAGADTYEAVLQMRGEAGRRQIRPWPETCAIHTHGYAMISTVLILRRC